jgi:hypothetical protein
MPKDSRIEPARCPDERLDSVNQKIVALGTSKPCHDVYGIFALSGRLARQAVDTALELKTLPGADAEQIQPVLDFWYRLSDYARTAALCCAGGNQTLAEALVTYQFLRTAVDEADDAS